MIKLIDGAPQGGAKEDRKTIIPLANIQKANDNDAVDHNWVYPDSVRRRIKVAFAKKLLPKDMLEEIVQAAEKNPSEDNKAILIHFMNELNRLPENEEMVEGLIVSSRFNNLLLKGGN